MVNFFPPNTWQMMTFLYPLATDSKNTIFISCRILGPGHLRPQGSVSVGFCGGASIEHFLEEGGVQPEGCIDPPPRKRKHAHPCISRDPPPCAASTRVPRHRVCASVQSRFGDGVRFLKWAFGRSLRVEW